MERSWPSPPSGSPSSSSRSSPRPRSAPCSPPATSPGGKDAATGRSCWWHCKPGCVFSELTGSTCDDVTLGTGASVRCLGKAANTGQSRSPHPPGVLRVWMTERTGLPSQPLSAPEAGRRLSTDAVQRLVRQHAATAALRCPSIRPDKLHPHILRHSCAMNTAARRRRHCRHRALARPCRHPLHQRLPARRHGHQATSPRPHHPHVRTARTLPSRRPTADLPGKPVIMPITATPATPRSRPTKRVRQAARDSA